MSLDHERLVNDKAEYPDYRNLPAQRELLREVDWDCLVVFDACRWDAMKILVEQQELEYPVEKSRLDHRPQTPSWLRKVWASETEDWSDVTFIAGNPILDSQNMTHTDSRDQDPTDFRLDPHVKRVIRPMDSEAWDSTLGTSRPEKLTEIARVQESPVVVHLMQPHEPFIGSVSLALHTQRQHLLNGSYDNSSTYHLVREGLVEPSVIRAAYLENLVHAWKKSRQLEGSFDRVVYTADHGENLGPERWGHAPEGDPRGMVVPWVETWREGSIGGADVPGELPF